MAPLSGLARRLAALATTAAILVAACGGSAASPAPSAAPPTTAPTSAPTAAPSASAPASASPSTAPSSGGVVPGDTRLDAGKPGGTFTGAWVGPCCVGVDNMNPMIAASGDHNFMHLIYEHLVTYAVVPDTVTSNPFSGHYGPLIPELADSWEVSADHLTWTFKLHPGVKWQDGTDFTSADVKFSFELCLDPKVGICYPGAGMGAITGVADVKAGKTTDITGITAPDPGTVTIKTDSPAALLPYSIMNLFIVQKASLGAVPRDGLEKSGLWSTPEKVIGTGPFKVVGHTAGQSTELGRWDGYWRGQPLLDKINRREFKDTTSALLAFDKGEVDYTYITADDVERESTNTSATILPGPSGVVVALVVNPLINKDWGDKRVRQAILSAIDRKSILRNIYHVTDPVPSNCLFIDPGLAPPDVPVFDFNADKAKQLLADANADVSKWGEVTFDTYYGDQGTLDAMTAIQANLAAIGITVKIQQMDSAAEAKLYNDGKAQMSLIGFGSGLAGGGYGRATFHSASAYPKGSNGWTGYSYSNPALDKLYDQLLTQFDPADQKATLQQICKIDADEQPFINLWATTRYWFVNNRIGNFVSTPGPAGGNYYNAAERWYVR